MADEQGDITVLLHQWSEGSIEAEDQLFRLVLPDLHRLAKYRMLHERPDHTLQTTDLVNEIYLKLVKARNQAWQNRQHFYAIAARAMRRYLIDYARQRPSAGLIPIDGMESFIRAGETRIDEAVLVDELLTRLVKIQPQWCQVVELKFFLGLKDDEAAEVLGLSLRTTQRMWRDARQWLFDQAESDRAIPKTKAAEQ